MSGNDSHRISVQEERRGLTAFDQTPIPGHPIHVARSGLHFWSYSIQARKQQCWKRLVGEEEAVIARLLRTNRDLKVLALVEQIRMKRAALSRQVNLPEPDGDMIKVTQMELDGLETGLAQLSRRLKVDWPVVAWNGRESRRRCPGIRPCWNCVPTIQSTSNRVSWEYCTGWPC